MPEPKKPKFRRHFAEQPAAEPPVPALGSPPANPEEFLEINREKSPEVVLNHLGENACLKRKLPPRQVPTRQQTPPTKQRQTRPRPRQQAPPRKSIGGRRI